MTPGARVQAAIEVLDRVLRGAAAERELTSWARRSRYAGSGDRSVVRDHVYDALRCLRSSAWRGGCGDVAPEEMDARAVMAGLLAGQGTDLSTLFTGIGHAPAPFVLPTALGSMPEAIALDVPDWILTRLVDRTEARAAFAVQRERAPIYLRTNPLRTSRDALLAMLSEAGHLAVADPLSPTAIRLTSPARGLAALPAFRDGSFEFQDAGSQALVDRLPIRPGERILDLCAGGGGKTLAMAARGAGPLVAHDAVAGRLRDLPVRAARAGVVVEVTGDPEAAGPFDAVVADVPCSGSGTWRRSPEAKWRLSPDRLEALLAVQDAILDRAVSLVRPGGWVAYMTCSLLAEENVRRVEKACRRDGTSLIEQTCILPQADGPDGFYLAVLRVGGEGERDPVRRF